jgi:WD40 repeat protein
MIYRDPRIMGSMISNSTSSSQSGYTIFQSSYLVHHPKLKKLSLIKFSMDASMVACVDQSGRYIYLVDLSIRRVVAELYRGRSQIDIRSISFSPDNQYLACITDRSKIHIFHLENVTQRFLELG